LLRAFPNSGEEGKGGKGFHSLKTIDYEMSRIFSILPELLKITSHEDNQKVELSRFRVWQSRERDILLYCAVRIWGPSAKFSHIMQSPYSQDFPGSGWQDSMP